GRLASAYGSGRKATAFRTVKIAVVTPMPSASDRPAAIVNPGRRPSERAPCTMSWTTVKKFSFIGSSYKLKTFRGHPPLPDVRAVVHPLKLNAPHRLISTRGRRQQILARRGYPQHSASRSLQPPRSQPRRRIKHRRTHA